MSGTSHPSVAREGGSLPRGLADARSVLVLEDPPAPPAMDHPGFSADGPLLVVAFTGADVRQLEDVADGSREHYVVDATPKGGTGEVGTDRPTVASVGSPSNLTEVGVAFDKLLARAGGADGRIDCCLPSLTALLQYVDRQRGYRFCNAVVNRLASVDASARFHLAAEAHDARTVDTFASLTDAVVRADADGATVVRSRRRA